MPKYKITLRRNISCYGVVEITAPDEDEACEKAATEAQNQVDGKESSLPKIDFSEIDSDEVEIEESEEL